MMFLSRRLLPVLLCLMVAPCVALTAFAEPFLGHIPVHPVVGGEPFTLDMNRFYEPAGGSTLAVQSQKDCEVSFDAKTLALKVVVSAERVGLLDIPIEMRDGKGARRSQSILTVAVAKRARHRFTYKPKATPKKLVVAGAFNGWNQDRTPMTDPDGDGVYEATVSIEPGTYHYKFVEDGNWMSDPSNPKKSEDGFGGFNSILAVEGPTGGAPPYLYPDRMEPGEAVIRIVEGADPVGDVSVVVQREDGSSSAAKYALKDGTIRISRKSVPKGAWVRLVATDKRGRASNTVRFRLSGGAFQWEDAILYFAFTDRFVNGDRSNDSPVRAEGMLWKGNFHGGDWAGIRQKIREGYFDSIGVNVLWISPVNENPPDAYREYTAPYRLYTGYHGYWPISSTRVDPHFGSAQDLKALVADAHQHGLKVIVDLVVNHVHDSHPFWKEHPDWFAARHLPDGSENLRLWDAHPFTTWFDRFLPSFDHTNDKAARFLIHNAEWWAREFDLDGFRQDAVKHVPPFFWRKLRAHFRQTLEKDKKRRLYMVGETFMDRHGIMSFVGPNMLDGQFDFPLYDTLRGVFAQKNAGFADLDASLAASERIYGKESLMSALVGNHDKSRFMAYADGDLPDAKEPDEEEVGWLRPPRVDRPASFDRLKMAMAFLMTIDGVPMVYYGDEFGMTGAGDPDNRRDMRFDEQLSSAEQAQIEYFSALTRVRRDHPALRYGHRRPVLVEADRYAYLRAYFDDRALVAFNRADRAADMTLTVGPELPDGEYMQAMDGSPLTVTGGKLKLSLKARSAAIVVSAGGARPQTRESMPESQAAPEPGYKSVGLAGTFNTWNANDPEFRLEYIAARSRWELVRLFQKGHHQFKFVMNGGWDVHRGAAEGAAASLEQPGKDISLDIAATGFYRIAYNPEQEKWALEASQPPAAMADARAPATATPGRAVTLDATPSLAREGRKIRAYTWSLLAPAGVTVEGLPATLGRPTLDVIFPRPGVYRIRLDVDDGEMGSPREIEISVRPSFQIQGAPGGRRDLEIGPDGKARQLIPVTSGEKFTMTLLMNGDSSLMFGAKESMPADAEQPARFTLVPGGRPITIDPKRSGVAEIRYDTASDKMSVRRSPLIRFRFDPSAARLDGVKDIEEVAVAGTFNQWNLAANALRRLADGTYETYLELPEGLHRYKFVVNGKHWIADPASAPDLGEPDGHGGMNSGVYVGERGSDFGLALPNRLISGALQHDPTNIDDFNMVTASRVNIRLRVREGDAEQVVLISRFPGVSVKRWPLTKLYAKQGFDYYGMTLTLPPKETKIQYIFELADGQALLYHTPDANKQGRRSVDQTTKWFNRELKPDFLTPDWAKNVVWYQIMPERWRNGDETNDPDRSVPWRWDWYKPVTAGETANFYGGDGVWHRFYGGDIKGLMGSLDYLEALGVTGIYLNPMFEATSHHKYNASDYRHIDDNFGQKGDILEAQAKEGADSAAWMFTPTDRQFLAFLDEAHRRGFKVILDGVFNHSGTDFWAFKDLVKNEKNSPYKDWYVVRQWDITPAHPGDPTFSYDGWAGFAGLPEYAENENGLLPGIRRHIFDITNRWMDPNGDGNPADGIDGWRLDVPENVHERFWVDWRKLVKGVNPDAYISGEIWENAASRLRGRHYDAVMNYEFTKRIFGFFLPGGTTPKLSASEFAKSLDDLQGWYLPQVNSVLQNLLGSHDVDRIASAIHNRAGWKRGRIQDDNPSYDPKPPSAADYEVLKRIAVVQMTWLGAPMIYYGDEVGMYGADDPSNRMPMWWKDLMPYDNASYVIRDDLLDHFKRLIAIRNSFPALRTGAARILLSDDRKQVVAFERQEDGRRVIVVIRNSSDPQTVSVPLPKVTASFVDVADPANTEPTRGVVEGIGSQRAQVRIRAGAKTTRPENGVLSVDLRARPWAILVEARTK